MNSTCVSMNIKQLDPSIGIGFYFRNRIEFENFCSEYKAAESNHTQNKLYSIQYMPAMYEYQEDEEGEDGESIGGGAAHIDELKDEEYVFI